MGLRELLTGAVVCISMWLPFSIEAAELPKREVRGGVCPYFCQDTLTVQKGSETNTTCGEIIGIGTVTGAELSTRYLNTETLAAAEKIKDLYPEPGAGSIFDPNADKIPQDHREKLWAYSLCNKRCGSAYYVDINKKMKRVSENRCTDSEEEIERRFKLPQLLPAKPDSLTCRIQSESCVEGQVMLDTSSDYRYLKWPKEVQVPIYPNSTVFDELGNAFNPDGSLADPIQIIPGVQAPRGESYQEVLEEALRNGPFSGLRQPQYQPYKPFMLQQEPFRLPADANRSYEIQARNPLLSSPMLMGGRYVNQTTFSPGSMNVAQTGQTTNPFIQFWGRIKTLAQSLTI